MDMNSFVTPSNRELNVPDESYNHNTDVSYVVLDLEMCKVKGSAAGRTYSKKMEIIQIGATLLDHDFGVVSKFDRYVKPEYGRIDGFIHSLTGINYTDLSAAGDLNAVLREFIEWIPENAIFVSWSMTDRSQLYGEMKAKGIHFDVFNEKHEGWIDCQKMFSEKMVIQRRYSLEEALLAADIFTEGNAHNGLVDAYNTALLFAKINKEMELVLNPYYKQAHDENYSSQLCCSIGELLAGLKFDPDPVVCAGV